ncbi:SAM-dependent methyltransferase [Nonomuraea sp. NPDC050536]|uniref:SAM-dependent methyltransferase n=1 Tax=Nonomuraea sp. NPDC050536 TaxID=3364366 RepID=UPI0037CA0B26
MHDDVMPAEFWDTKYSERDQYWSGEPNASLVREVSGLAPGRALDLGCGEGGDAIWLAVRGWRVTAVDISQVALERAARHAAEAGVAGLIDWQRHDLGDSFPAGDFDLVTAAFLHSPTELPRERILRRAAEAVAPGGILLIVGHGAVPWQEENHDHADLALPTPGEVLDALDLPDGQWKVLVDEEYEQTHTAHDGRHLHRTNNTLKLARTAPTPEA